MKQKFLKYIGSDDSLVRYQRSYKLVLLKAILANMDDDGKATVVDVLEYFTCFYKKRQNLGLPTDVAVDLRIANIMASEPNDVLEVIKRNPFKAISSKGFLYMLKHNGVDYFSLPKDLMKEFTAHDLNKLEAVLDAKIKLYYSKIDAEYAQSYPLVREGVKMKSKYDHLFGEIFKLLIAAQKPYRKEYDDALDMEDIECAHEIQRKVTARIHQIRGWERDLKKIHDEISSSGITCFLPESSEENECDEVPQTEHEADFDAPDMIGFNAQKGAGDIEAAADELFIDVHKNQKEHGAKRDDEVGQYVRENMRILSRDSRVFSMQEIYNLLDRRWCKENLNIDSQFLKIYDKHKNISSQIVDERGSEKYWDEIFRFGTLEYLLYSQWVNADKEYFDRWFSQLCVKKHIPGECLIQDHAEDGCADTADIPVGEYMFKNQNSVTIFGQVYTFKSWSELLVKVCEIMLLKTPYIVAKFYKEKRLNPNGQVNFSYDKFDIKHNPKRLTNKLYIETEPETSDIVSFCRDILSVCGFKPSDIEFK